MPVRYKEHPKLANILNGPALQQQARQLLPGRVEEEGRVGILGVPEKVMAFWYLVFLVPTARGRLLVHHKVMQICCEPKCVMLRALRVAKRSQNKQHH
jgi:hypothetical protein